MSLLRWTLVGLLVASTALFATGMSAEPSERDTQAEAAGAQSPATETEPAHDESEGAREVTGKGMLSSIDSTSRIPALRWWR